MLPDLTTPDTCPVCGASEHALERALGRCATKPVDQLPAAGLFDAEARRAIAALNRSQAGYFHWWFVAEQPHVTIEPETNLELSQAVSE